MVSETVRRNSKTTDKNFEFDTHVAGPCQCSVVDCYFVANYKAADIGGPCANWERLNPICYAKVTVRLVKSQ